MKLFEFYFKGEGKLSLKLLVNKFRGYYPYNRAKTGGTTLILKKEKIWYKLKTNKLKSKSFSR